MNPPQKASVVVLGPQFGDSHCWVHWFSRRFSISPTRYRVNPSDDALACNPVVWNDLELTIRSPMTVLFHKKLVYEAMLREASAIVYVVSALRELAFHNDGDFEVFASARITVAPTTPVLTLLNDVHCGQWQGSPNFFTEQEATRWLVLGSRMRQTSIGCYPASGPCEVGAEDSFADLIKMIVERLKV